LFQSTIKFISKYHFSQGFHRVIRFNWVQRL